MYIGTCKKLGRKKKRVQKHIPKIQATDVALIFVKVAGSRYTHLSDLSKNLGFRRVSEIVTILV